MIRILLAFAWYPTGDVQAFDTTGSALAEHGFDFYSHVNSVGVPPYGRDNYNYPPGYLPVLLAAHWLANVFGDIGLRFHHIVRFVPMACDIALAWIVQANLPSKRYGMRMLAAAAIAIGPSFIVSSAIEAQIDVVAILPGVGAVLLWQKAIPNRALWCGLLIGIGIAVKTVPALLILALLPTVVSLRELARVVTGAAVVPVALVAPFAAWNWSDTLNIFRYRGFPGAGGISLLFQPGLAEGELGLGTGPLAYSWLQNWGWLLTVTALVCAVAVCCRAKLTAVPTATVLWLVVYATSMNWYPQYMGWGLPFLLLSGFVIPVIVADVVLAVTLFLTYQIGLGHYATAIPQGRASWMLYAALMDALWLAAAAGAVGLVRKYSRLAAP